MTIAEPLTATPPPLPEWRARLAGVVQQAMAATRLTAAQLATASGVEKRQIYRLLNAETTINPRDLLRIRRILAIPVDALDALDDG